MKIKKSILLGASALIASCSVLAACGGTVSEGTSTATTVAETTAETTKAAETTTSNVSSETTTTAAGATTAAESGSRETVEATDKNIVGNWASRDFDGLFIYTFNEDGTGNYDASGTQMPFTFTMEGDKLSVLFDSDTDSFDTVYKIEGNTLTIKDSLGEDVIYDKK